MAFFNEFPHTRNYDSDLGWLIANVKRLIEKFKRCPTWYGEWVAEIEYPPLAFVQYGADGDTYLSLKEVPANTPITDENYWMKTGSTLEQILEIQRRLSSVETSVEDMGTRVDTIEEEVEKGNYYGRSVLLIGDSLCDENLTQSAPCWVTYFRTLVEQDGGNVTNFSFSGIGITDAVTPTIQTKLNDIPVGDYTDVVIWLGCNDWSMNATWQQVRTQFVNVANKILDIAPNSRKWFVLPHRWKNSRNATMPLTWFSFVLTKFCANRWGYYVVNPAVELPNCNPNVQRLSTFCFVSDTDQHFKPSYAPIIADYFYNRLNKQVSSGGDKYTVPIRLESQFSGATIDTFTRGDGSVTIGVNMDGATTTANPQRIATLPEWARPLHDITIDMHAQKSNGDLKDAYIQINANGSTFFVGEATSWRYCKTIFTFETLAGVYTVD